MKHEKNGCRFGLLVGPPGGPNLTGNRFFQVFITPNYPKCEKNQLPVLPTIRQARPSTRLNFYQWRFFYFWIIWSWFGKKISTKKTFELLFDNWWRHHARLILKFFWSKIFQKNYISNFLRSLSFFEIAVIFLELLSFFEVDINCKPHFRTLPNLTYDNEIPHLSFFGDC